MSGSSSAPRSESAGIATERGDGKPAWVFFFPHHPPSGVSSLFARMAQELVRQEAGRATLVDFADGAMARMKGEGVEFVEYRRDARLDIAAHETLVLQAEVPGKLRRQLAIHPAARLIEWQLHPYNLIPSLVPLLGHWDYLLRRPALYRRVLRTFSGRHMDAAAEFVRLATARRSVFFYDEPALRATESLLGVRIPEPPLLPVAVAVPPAPPRLARTASDELHVVWVGRLYDFKIRILVHTLRSFRAHAARTGRKIVFHVVGSGPRQGELAEFAAARDAMTVVQHGDLSTANLRELLVRRADLVASMGTAALEGAAAGLPVILLDLAYSNIPAGYRFRWLHEAKGFDLGHTITLADCGHPTDRLDEMLGEIDRDYAAVAARDFDYVRRNHSIAALADRFAAMTAAADLTFGAVPARLWKKSPVRRAYERLCY